MKYVEDIGAEPFRLFFMCGVIRCTVNANYNIGACMLHGQSRWCGCCYCDEIPLVKGSEMERSISQKVHCFCVVNIMYEDCTCITNLVCD